jgi:flavin-dependent dehydrogenase
MTTFIGFEEEKDIKTPGFMLDRKIFSSWLIESFMEKSGKYHRQTKATSFEEEKDHVTTTVISKGSQSHISSRFVVGADGPDSLVGKYIGSINERFVLGLNENIPVEAKDKGRTMVFFTPDVPGGYGWLFPRRKSINLGIGCAAPYDRVTDSLDLKGIYRGFKKKIFSMDIIKSGGSSGRLPSGKMTAGLIPSSGMIENTVKGKFILAGDAAGLSNPITGAGIYGAVLSADIISRNIVNALKKGDPEMVNRIKDEFKSAFSISLSRAAAKRNILLSRWPESIRNGDAFSSLIKDTWIAFKPYWRK